MSLYIRIKGYNQSRLCCIWAKSAFENKKNKTDFFIEVKSKLYKSIEDKNAMTKNVANDSLSRS